MKAAIIHHNINSRGGGERVAIHTIELLNDMGFDIELVTSQKPDLNAIYKAYGRKIKINKIVSLFPFKFGYFGIYQRLLTIIPAIRVRNVDILINTHGDVLPYYLPTGAPYIAYVHFPVLSLLMKEYPSKYQNSFFWRTYFKPYRFLTKKLMEFGMKKGVILTNSNFSKQAIKKLYPDVEPIIVYPPVDIKSFSKIVESTRREDKVVVISRFTPEKKLENAIRIMKMLPDNIKLEIIGSLIPSNNAYYNNLKEIIVKENLETRIVLKANIEFDELIDVMATSKVYLHTMFGEHFGISIVEAMSAGLITIVPNYGGQTEHVPPHYQYEKLEEAAKIITQAMNATQNQRNELNKIAQRFSEDRFKQEMQRIITTAMKKEV